MARTQLPPPSFTLSKAEARRFLLAHQHLWPPRQLNGKDGILDHIRHVGCIQFDPINVVGRNPDLVLQSRVAGYRPELLEELLYTDRQLVDGFDKVASIYPVTDWPFFARYRTLDLALRRPVFPELMQVAPTVKEAIRDRGPLSSIDLDIEQRVDWAWGETRVVRAVLETLYTLGEIGIHHRVSTRRVFDLIERLLPVDLLAAPDPNETEEAYQEWHVLRRLGGIGLGNVSATDCWLGILDVKTTARKAILARLVEKGEVIAVAVEGVDKQPLFIRTVDLPTLEAIREASPPAPEATLIGALDNLIWDRDLIRWIFDFDYVWEVYKPVAKRQYGYYVLPVLFGDRFVARLDPAFDKKTRQLTLENWWWEDGVQPDTAMESALVACFQEFGRYLDASEIRAGEKIAGEKSLQWMASLQAG